MALELKIALYTNDECDELLLEDETDLYSSDNTGGYGSPNPAVNDVTGVTITLTYSKLGVDLVFALTLVNGVITAATMTFDSATPINILSLLTSTTWPFTSANPFSLTTTDYSDTLPALADMVYEVEYVIEGSTGGTPFEYTTTDTELVSCETCCCISKKGVKIDINDTDNLVKNLIPSAMLKVAKYANANGNTDQANTFQTRAMDICENGCGCGC